MSLDNQQFSLLIINVSHALLILMHYEMQMGQWQIRIGYVFTKSILKIFQAESSWSVIVSRSTNLKSKGPYHITFLSHGSDHLSDQQEKNKLGANVTLPSIY